MTGPASSPAGSGFRHEAALYRGDLGFLDATVGFVRDGLAAGEPVLVAVNPPKIDLLRAALGQRAGQVNFVDLAQVGRNPARIIPMWRDAVEGGGGGRLRGIGEPVWRGRGPAELAEALLHEALLNVAFADGANLLLRCPYDVEALGDAVAAEARCRHPVLVEGRAETSSTDYRAASNAAGFAAPLPAAPAGCSSESFPFDSIAAVRSLRAKVGERAVRLGIGGARAADLMLAVHEMTVNSLRHGGGRGTLRLWSEGDALVCEVADGGHIEQPLVGRIRPRPGQLSGRGMWLANQLCDLVQVRSSGAGTTVRLHMRF